MSQAQLTTCPFCLARTDDHWKFCPLCGINLSASASATTPQQLTEALVNGPGLTPAPTLAHTPVSHHPDTHEPEQTDSPTRIRKHRVGISIIIGIALLLFISQVWAANCRDSSTPTEPQHIIADQIIAEPYDGDPYTQLLTEPHKVSVHSTARYDIVSSQHFTIWSSDENLALIHNNSHLSAEDACQTIRPVQPLLMLSPENTSEWQSTFYISACASGQTDIFIEDDNGDIIDTFPQEIE